MAVSGAIWLERGMVPKVGVYPANRLASSFRATPVARRMSHISRAAMNETTCNTTFESRPVIQPSLSVVSTIEVS